jgi:hypothetical protein
MDPPQGRAGQCPDLNAVLSCAKRAGAVGLVPSLTFPRFDRMQILLVRQPGHDLDRAGTFAEDQRKPPSSVEDLARFAEGLRLAGLPE